ncbi:sushi, von Willebrand factor type A, EGF and pentraxin domain-containing protein 1-like [Dysidea avara]|uniref:sushi, von Willebrand factor type A, EGF and pentraxin domain-containing protein 1-like n=1 Tax=Dysidea avara TaxID=196820 RepID=UPI00333479F5
MELTENFTQAICQEQTCPPLTAPDNGDIDCSLGDGQPSLGDSCTFTCDGGHELSGSVIRSCQIDGSWSGTETICTLVPTCPPLTVPDNGDIDCSLGDDGEAIPGDTCTFTCDDGYELGGSTSRACGDNGNWSGTDTTCTRVTCPPLTPLDNGRIECSLGDDETSIEGGSCIYICDEGFEISGTIIRECQSNGSWSGDEPTCERLTCPPLTSPDNGSIECSLGDDGTSIEGSSCIYICDEGFEISGTIIRECQSNGSWSGDEPTCERLTCLPLTSPDNGSIECSLGDDGTSIEGSSCIYICDEGFEISGTIIRECQSNGSWSGDEPTCERLPICPPLTAPDNGDIDCSLGDDGEANPGDTCTSTCDDGYELGGSTSRTCGDDGSWSGTDTTCTRVPTCPPLVDAPRNGNIDCSLGDDGEANPGDTCTYTCNDGFGLQDGSTTRTCQNDGSWSGTEPRCRRVCDLLTAPDNGDIDCSLGGDGAANPGDTCTFTCDNGFTLRGSAMRECQFQRSKGTSWSGNEASCEPGHVCPPLMAPENGMIDCSLGDDGAPTNGDTCTVTCNDGFTLRGDATRTCRITRRRIRWLGDEASCVQVPRCPPLTAPDNGDIDCSLGDDGEANPGDTCTFTCDDGYELGGSTSKTCGDDGSWSGTDTTCTIVPTCPPLTVPDDGDIDCSLGDDGEANPGNTCTFTCDDGYELGGSTSRTCGDDGRWSGNDTTCTRVCPPLTFPDNGDIDCSLGDDGEANPGDTCTFTCDDGYELGGSTSRTCGDDGSWSSTDTTCTTVPTCPPLTAPDNGDIDCSLGDDGEANPGEANPGDTCTFTCDDGYELGGSTSRTCGDNESWNGTDITCTRAITCPPLIDAPRNGDIDCSLGEDGEANPGDTCTYTCNDGFGLQEGSTIRTCQTDGIWSGTELRCRRVCDPLVAPDDGMIVCSLRDDGEANPGDTCTFTCDDGFRLRGSAKRECQFQRSKGTSWSGNEARCEPGRVCPTLMAPENGMIDCSLGDDGDATNGDTCTFTCDNGFTLRGSVMRECRINRRRMDWNGDEARCVPGRVCPSLKAPENGIIDCSLGGDGAATNGDTCTITCNDGYTLRGDATRTCRTNRRIRWLGDDAHCMKVAGTSCDPLSAPDNGMIDCSLGGDGVPTAGDTCRFTCNDGFEISGSQARRCRIRNNRGRWTGNQATCNMVTTCPVLSAPDNGQISCSPGNDSPGDTCTFTCDDGFEISGTQSRTCQDNGTWNGVDDTLCTITCPVLSAPDNGQISCSPRNDSPGDTCTFTCDDGFEISGTQSRTCQDDGTWNGVDDTVCTVTTCPVLSAPDDGQISCSPGNDSPGDTCTFTCDDGFEISGTQSRTCQDDGNWNGVDDTLCTVTTCLVLSAPDNGQISCSPGNDSPGDTCTFTCDDGFEISGTQSRTCQDDLTWSGFDDTYCLGCFDIGSITVRTVTRGDRATVTFSSHRDATFTCQLDSGTAVACTSPQAYTGLSVGHHSITLVSTCPGETEGISNTSTFRIRG